MQSVQILTRLPFTNAHWRLGFWRYTFVGL